MKEKLSKKPSLLSPDFCNRKTNHLRLRGATGSILLVSLITALEKEDKSVGCVTLCVAGGQSISAVIERC
ncbi:MAG: hypothetical protein IT342_00770 [Candidatus Melainabacteria bacterium]|nr:hypothetical protein [Candidatus Melainabacteria bacterium]